MFRRASNIHTLTIFTFSLPIEHNLDNTLFFFFKNRTEAQALALFYEDFLSLYGF